MELLEILAWMSRIFLLGSAIYLGYIIKKAMPSSEEQMKLFYKECEKERGDRKLETEVIKVLADPTHPEHLAVKNTIIEIYGDGKTDLS